MNQLTMAIEEEAPAARFTFPRGLVIPVLLVAAWELVFSVGGFQSDSLAPPSRVALALARGLANGEILRATGQTLSAAMIGLAIAGVIGLIMGIFRGLFWRLDYVLDVTTEALRPIPSSALIPVMILIFGFGYRLESACVAFSCTWTIFILARTAVMGVEPRLLEVAKVLQLGLMDRTFKIILPAALPRIFVAFRLAAGLSLIVAVTCEVTANPLGMGFEMMSASQSLRPELTLAYLVWIGFIGWFLNAILVYAQHRFFGPAASVGAVR
ncbi:ABC transporter permease subunit [Rhizobium sp. BK060]|uniref:ABC transporter permease n=1 Tax=Rhizobium sp. BK060 TaxID=2587096 RepID=UPI0017F520EC|nr:ABC transporter permease subunit [Rhizobium sp. BK060]MBB3396022.1 NitT/TauT family transport system permease protein [Rhizobium sp. BK060]